MIPKPRILKHLEERLFHGAHADQRKVAVEYLPKLRLGQSEAGRIAETIRQNWLARNAEWGDGLVPPPVTVGAEIPPDGWEPFERTEDSRLAGTFRRLGTVATGLELFTAGYAAQFWLDLPPVKASAVGVAVAGAYTYLAKSLWGIGHQDHSNHWPEFKRRERMLWCVGAVNSVLLGSFGVVRFLTVPEWVYWLQLGALSALLPIFAAGCFVLARLISERNRLCSEYWSTRNLIKRLQNLLDRAKEILGLNKDEEASHA
jgi:hypothetical protein